MKSAISLTCALIFLITPTLSCKSTSYRPERLEMYHVDIMLRIGNCPWDRAELFYVTELGRSLMVDYRHPTPVVIEEFVDHDTEEMVKKERLVIRSWFSKRVEYREYPPGQVELVIDGQSRGVFQAKTMTPDNHLPYEVSWDCEAIRAK